MVKILCVIPALPNKLKMETLTSIFNQSVPVNYIYVLTGQSQAKELPQKVSAVLNDGLNGLQLEKFDYLLRVDNDSVLPYDFVEKNLALGVDVVGGEGYAQLIKVSFLLEKMHGFFNKDSDDTYTYFKAHMCGLASERVTPVYCGHPGLTHNKIQYALYSGRLNYMVGVDPVDVILNFRLSKQQLFLTIGYFLALFSFKPSFEFAKIKRSRSLNLMFRRII